MPRLLVGGDSAHWGPSVFHSDDLGATWVEPAQPAVKFPQYTGASLERVWQLHPAAAEAPDVVYAGTEPAALFRSEDRGESFELVRPLWEHPTRSKWVPGGGGEGLHTDPHRPERDPRAVTVAVSTAGVFRTKDGGASWAPSNNGVSAVFLPDPNPEFGQCVHKVARDAVDSGPALSAEPLGCVPQRRRRATAGRTSARGCRPTSASPLPPIRTARDTAYVFPINADADRVPAEHRCRVFRTSDAGNSWEPLSAGLPEETHYGTVLRDALCTDDADPAGVYFGNRNGEVYASSGRRGQLGAARLASAGRSLRSGGGHRRLIGPVV